MLNGVAIVKALESWSISQNLPFAAPQKDAATLFDALAREAQGVAGGAADEVARFQTVLNVAIEAQRRAGFGKPISPANVVQAIAKRPFAERLASMLGIVETPLPMPICTTVSGLPGTKSGQCVTGPGAKPKEHQVDVARFIRDRDGLIVVHEPGTGKTLLATMAIKCWLDQDVKNRAIVVTPSTNVDAFVEHISCAFPKESKTSSSYAHPVAAKAKDKDKDKQLEEWQRIGESRKWVILFETREMPQGRVAITNANMFQRAMDTGKIQCDEHLMLIIDEAHLGFTHDITIRQQEERPVAEGKKEEAKVAAAGFRCMRRAGKRVLMTATPVTNEPYKFANLVAMARGDDRILSRVDFEKMLRNYWNGDSLEALMDGYRQGELSDALFRENAAQLRSNRKYRAFVKETPIAALLPAMETWIAKWRAPFANYLSCLITFKRRDPPGPNFPRVTHIRETPELEVQMTPAFFEAYKEREAAIRGTKENAFLNALRMASYQLAGESPKLDWIVGKMRENAVWEEGGAGGAEEGEQRPKAWQPRRTFIFSNYKDASTKPMVDRLIASGVDPLRIVRIDGTVPKKLRKGLIDSFNAGNEDVMVGTVVMGVGVSLKGVRDVFLLESQWSEADEEQAWSRAVRANSHAHLPPGERAVNVYTPVLVKPKDKASLPGEKISADQRVMELAKQKQPEIDEFLRILQDVSIENNREACMPPGVA